MPCRKENYIFLEQSVTVDSKEVDALVTKIGEALQLHTNNGTSQKAMSCLHGISANNGGGSTNVKQASNVNNVGAAMQRRNPGCCMRLRNRSHRSSRASPYNIPGSNDQEWAHIKPWNKKRITAEDDDDDPHRLLQELILSGNLIKEAVRRLQFPAADCGDFSTTDNVPC
ncbi:unnamed protein product [Lota lota]